jgi:hypothetical protein
MTGRRSHGEGLGHNGIPAMREEQYSGPWRHGFYVGF